MSKYDALGNFLRSQRGERVPLTFAKVEQITGTKLPNSKRYPAWWSNNAWNNVMTKVWLDAGFRTEQVDIEGAKLVFRRDKKENAEAGMAEARREFQAKSASKLPRRSPLFGALKGTFTIERGYDLTRPTLNPDDLAEHAANLERTADLIEKGTSRKSR